MPLAHPIYNKARCMSSCKIYFTTAKALGVALACPRPTPHARRLKTVDDFRETNTQLPSPLPLLLPAAGAAASGRPALPPVAGAAASGRRCGKFSQRAIICLSLRVTLFFQNKQQQFDVALLSGVSC